MPSRRGVNYVVRARLLKQTQQLLRDAGRGRDEAYLVWVGRIEGVSAVVLQVWSVSAEARAAHARVPIDEVLELGKRVSERHLFILAQVHSHPGKAFHSPIDDEHPISSQVGFLSIVVPNFAKDAAGDGWAYYEHEGHGRWHQLTDYEVAQRIVREQHWWQRLLGVITGRVFSSGR